MPMSPATINLITGAASHLLSAVPKGQLARLGLSRAVPALAPIPVVGAAVGGALLVALAVPKSRRWLADRASRLYSRARAATASSDGPPHSTDSNAEPSDEAQQVIPLTVEVS